MAALGWIIKRVLAIASIVLVLFGGYLAVTWAVPELTEIWQTDEQLEQVQADKATEESALQTTKKNYEERIEEARNESLTGLIELTSAKADELRESIGKLQETVTRASEGLCTDRKKWWEGVLGKVGIPKPCTEAEEAYQKAKAELESHTNALNEVTELIEKLTDPELSVEEKYEIAGSSLDGYVDPEAESQIAELEKTIDDLKIEEERLLKTQDSWVWMVIEIWRDRWVWFVGAGLVLLLARPLTKVFNFFVAMPLVTRVAKPVRLSTGVEADRAKILVGPAKRSLFITLTPGEVLSARAQHVRDVHGKVRGRLLYNWGAPFISFAAGLCVLSRVTSNGGVAQLTISNPKESDSYVMRIDFQDHPGIVMHPKHVVGVIGTPQLKTRWWWGWHFLATGQARYILFAGSGSLLVQGISDIVARTPSGEGSKMEQNLVMGFDSRLTVEIERTENFYSYFQGEEPLVDEVFSGPHPYFWQKTATDGTKNAIERGFDTFFSAIGKVFGF